MRSPSSHDDSAGLTRHRPVPLLRCGTASPPAPRWLGTAHRLRAGQFERTGGDDGRRWVPAVCPTAGPPASEAVRPPRMNPMSPRRPPFWSCNPADCAAATGPTRPLLASVELRVWLQFNPRRAALSSLGTRAVGATGTTAIPVSTAALCSGADGAPRQRRGSNCPRCQRSQPGSVS
jgi:hypothetical protein